MKIIDCEQYSPEWWAARLGKPSASNFDKLLTTKMERSKQREKYMFQLAGELVAGVAEETYQNAAMKRGIEMEGEAREYYEFITGREVKKVGFCLSDDETYGASPDGIVDGEGCLEIKCPSIAVHVGYLLGGVLPMEYFQQVQGQLTVTNFKWGDFLSYYPGLPHFLIRVNREEPFTNALKRDLDNFAGGLAKVIEQIRRKA